MNIPRNIYCGKNISVNHRRDFTRVIGDDDVFLYKYMYVMDYVIFLSWHFQILWYKIAKIVAETGNLLARNGLFHVLYILKSQNIEEWNGLLYVFSKYLDTANFMFVDNAEYCH
jgi:hypothetical protein